MAGGLRAVAIDGRPEGSRGPDARRRSSSRRSKRRPTTDPLVRRYLALAIGRLDPPLPPRAIEDLTRALDSTRRRHAHQRHLGARLVRRCRRRADARAALRVAGRRDPEDGGLRARRASRRGADRDAAQGAPGFHSRRAVERRGRARAQGQPRRRAGAAADARSPVRGAGRHARRAAGRRTAIRLPRS